MAENVAGDVTMAENEISANNYGMHHCTRPPNCTPQINI